jgi:translation elongation factor EF-1beta
MYGISSVNVPSILSNLTHLKSADYVTKIIRTLRSKKYIYYQDRKGHRGSFEVRFDYWLGKKGVIFTFDATQGGKYIRGPSKSVEDSDSEVPSKLSNKNPRLDIESGLVNTVDIAKYRPDFLRGGNNDTEKEKETNDLSNSNNEIVKQPKVTTLDFIPKSYEEQRCKEIAIEIGDLYMNFTISVLRDKKGGIDLLEEAISAFKEAKSAYSQKGTPIRNSGALFNKIIKGLRERNKYPKYG